MSLRREGAKEEDWGGCETIDVLDQSENTKGVMDAAAPRRYNATNHAVQLSQAPRHASKLAEELFALVD